MALRIAPFLPEQEAAAARFNQRMREGKAASDFLLPESAGDTAPGPLRPVHLMAADSDGEIHGGMICVAGPARVKAQTSCVWNLQAVLSEGLINPRYTMVGAQLVRF
ncbi:MAG TPA: hypothetical protein VJ732_07740, partial [Bryobacteraceae bacterium]|nr:hypothetical protein [Bryobacteraceae bacterium]